MDKIFIAIRQNLKLQTYHQAPATTSDSKPSSKWLAAFSYDKKFIEQFWLQIEHTSRVGSPDPRR